MVGVHVGRQPQGAQLVGLAPMAYLLQPKCIRRCLRNHHHRPQLLLSSWRWQWGAASL
jgi:hypothetical protein